jgi:ABC-type transport system substrate-binding protein
MLACDREPFSDQRVRNALEHAMDRNALVQGVSLGLYQPWFSQVAEASPLKLQNTGIEHDLDRARALMSEAGYADGFSMNIVPLPQYPEMIRAAEILKEQWAAINVEVEVRVEDPGVVGDIFTTRARVPTTSSGGPTPGSTSCSTRRWQRATRRSAPSSTPRRIR